MSPESWFQEGDGALETIGSRMHPTPTRIGSRAFEIGPVRGHPRLHGETRKRSLALVRHHRFLPTAPPSAAQERPVLLRTGGKLNFLSAYAIVEDWTVSAKFLADVGLPDCMCAKWQSSVFRSKLKVSAGAAIVTAGLETLTGKTRIPTFVAARPLAATHHKWRSRHGYGVCRSLRNPLCVSTCA